MLERDKELLENLVNEYSFDEIIRSLAFLASKDADDWSDMGFPDRARGLTQLSLCLEKLISESK